MVTETLKSDARIDGINSSKIEDCVWAILYRIITTDSNVMDKINAIYSAYPKVFIENVGGMPLLVINRPSATEETLTLGTNPNYVKEYDIRADIHIATNDSRTAKQISDATRKSFEDSTSTFHGYGLHDFEVIAHRPDFDIRNKIKVNYDVFTVQLKYYA